MLNSIVEVRRSALQRLAGTAELSIGTLGSLHCTDTTSAQGYPSFPDIDYSGAVVACMVYPNGLSPGQELSYKWTLSNGVIASGQGTRRIVVSPPNNEAGTLKAEVEVGNLDSTCEKNASYVMPIGSPVKSNERN